MEESKEESCISDKDDLLDDLMNIVQNEPSECPNKIIADEVIISNNANNNNAEETRENTTELEDDNDYDDDSEEYFVELNDDENNTDIDEMLEKPIDAIEDKDQCKYYTYDKLQIKNIYWRSQGQTILPEGWIQVTHSSGIPLYLHRSSRVCTLSRPYYINEYSARKHDIPIGSIPCMAYKKRKEAVESQMKEHKLAKQQAAANASKCPFSVEGVVANENGESNVVEDGNGCSNKGADISKKVVVSIQTNEDKSKENLLSPEELTAYCKLLFEFDTVRIKKFKTWGDRKTFIKKAKLKYPSKIPENAKMLKIQTKTQKGINRELNINMTNKTTLSILYEYASQVHKSNPRFEIIEKENPKDPFQAICYIADKISGKGIGNSKKMAKNAAAEAALSVLVPGFKDQVSTDVKKDNEDVASFFDVYPVEHSHIYIQSQKLGSPLPYDILLTCLKYNYAINMSRNHKQFIEETITPIKYRNCLYRMKLGQYDVEVNCTKKKEGRQLAAQKILQLMHEHITNWGSMLRLYSTKMSEAYLHNDFDESGELKTEKKAISEKKPAEDSSHAAKPNKKLIEKLKEEMRKLKKPSVAKTDYNEILKETLLTIPPLILGDQLESANYLMTSVGSKVGQSDNKDLDSEIDGNDGKIAMLTENGSSKKRKLDGAEESDVESLNASDKSGYSSGDNEGSEEGQEDGELESSEHSN